MLKDITIKDIIVAILFMFALIQVNKAIDTWAHVRLYEAAMEYGYEYQIEEELDSSPFVDLLIN